MRILFIGGTGIISGASTRLALERGEELWLLNRGQRAPVPGARHLVADHRDSDAVRAALGNLTFDAVVNFVAYTPDDIERDLAVFSGRTRQYVFISSASAYQKPPQDWPITESSPLVNPHWQYSRDKIAGEERLLRAFRDHAFPVTIVRPSLTYDETMVPLALNAWQRPYTIVDRMRRGKKVIVPGDGTSLWTVTHSADFAVGLLGLLGQPRAIGQAFHITRDDAATWDILFAQTAAAAGAELRAVHIASDWLVACVPDWEGTLIGDKSQSGLFDNAKIKRFVPEFQPRIPFADGVARSIAWMDADPARRAVDEALDRQLDALIDAYEAGLAAARQRIGAGTV